LEKEGQEVGPGGAAGDVGVEARGQGEAGEDDVDEGDAEEGGAAEDTNAVPLAELTRRYTSNVNELISLVLDRPVFQRASAVVRPWLVRHTKMRAVMTRVHEEAAAAKLAAAQ
jgi:hypothetical protein